MSTMLYKQVIQTCTNVYNYFGNEIMAHNNIAHDTIEKYYKKKKSFLTFSSDKFREVILFVVRLKTV